MIRAPLLALAMAIGLHNCAGAATIEMTTKAAFSRHIAGQCAGVKTRAARGGPTVLHRTLPCGTRLEITNKANGRKIVAVVIGRGGTPARALTLNTEGAERLAMRRAGVAPVKYRVLEPEPVIAEHPIETTGQRQTIEVGWVMEGRFFGCQPHTPCEGDR